MQEKVETVMEKKIHTKSLGNQMPKAIKCLYYTITLFGNTVWNKVPSRHLRRWFYKLLGAKMGKNTFPCRRVEVLLPQGLKLGDGVAVGWCNDGDIRSTDAFVQSKDKKITYTVRRGDTLSKIAKENNVTVAKLQKDNGIKNPNKIYVGQKILIQ